MIKSEIVHILCYFTAATSVDEWRLIPVTVGVVEEQQLMFSFKALALDICGDSAVSN